jgi:hypothetical protein
VPVEGKVGAAGCRSSSVFATLRPAAHLRSDAAQRRSLTCAGIWKRWPPDGLAPRLPGLHGEGQGRAGQQACGVEGCGLTGQVLFQPFHLGRSVVPSAGESRNSSSSPSFQRPSPTPARVRVVFQAGEHPRRWCGIRYVVIDLNSNLKKRSRVINVRLLQCSHPSQSMG